MIGALWVIFRFVVADEELVLSYLKVLAWPSVVAIAGYWFREPIKEKLGQLIGLEALGARANFAGLEQRLQSNVDALLDDGDGGLPSDDDVLADKEHVDHTDGPALTPAGGAGSEVSTDQVADRPAEPQAAQLDQLLDMLPATLVREQLLHLARAMDLSVALRHDLWDSRLPPGEAMAQATKQLMGAASRLKDRRASRHEATRENIESVIQTSAEWGYEMGRAGATRAVPDIEWNDDGSWRITTAVPPRRPPSHPVSDVARRRLQIEQLEEEIKALERKRHRDQVLGNPLGGMFNTDDGWLRSLKKKLAELDPGNVWASFK